MHLKFEEKIKLYIFTEGGTSLEYSLFRITCFVPFIQNTLFLSYFVPELLGRLKYDPELIPVMHVHFFGTLESSLFCSKVQSEVISPFDLP